MNAILNSRHRRNSIKRKKSKSFISNIIFNKLVIFILILSVLFYIFQDNIMGMIHQNYKLSDIFNSIKIKYSNIKNNLDSNKKLETSNFVDNGYGSIEYSIYEIDDEDTSDEDAVIEESKKSEHMFIMPVNGSLSSKFGNRKHPIRKKVEFHKGIDIKSKVGEAIRASDDGQIIEAANSPSYGKYLKIKHKDGFLTVYAHCSKLRAKKNQMVKRGDIIGEAGDTGISIGPHLHFEIIKDNVPQNPLLYVNVDRR